MRSSKVLFVAHQGDSTVCYDHPLLESAHPTNLKCSGSVIISMAEKLAEDFPGLQPPNHSAPDQLYFNCWSEVLSEAVLQSCAHRVNDVLYINVWVGLEYIAQLLNCGFKSTDLKPSLPPTDPGRKNILLLSMSQRTKTLNKPRIDLKALYLGLYYNNENWRTYNIFEEDFPKPEVLETANVVVMPGSSLSIYDYDYRVERLKQILKDAFTSNANLRYVGVCFGAQFLAHIFGGKVTKAKQRVFRIETISMHEERILEHQFLRPLSSTPSLSVSEFHNDEISELPSGFKLLADSPSCQTEVLLSECSRYFGMQCHPDYTQEYMNNFLLTLAGSSCPLQHDYPVKGTDQHTELRECIANFLALP